MIQYFIDIPKTFRQAKVNLLDGSVFDQEELRGRHPYTDANEMQKAEIACLNDRRVKAAIAKLDLPEQATVIVEPWTYATDGMNDMAGRIIMVSHLACTKEGYLYLHSVTFTPAS